MKYEVERKKSVDCGYFDLDDGDLFALLHVDDRIYIKGRGLGIGLGGSCDDVLGYTCLRTGAFIKGVPDKVIPYEIVDCKFKRKKGF
jgi:hypothetical protein